MMHVGGLGSTVASDRDDCATLNVRGVLECGVQFDWLDLHIVQPSILFTQALASESVAELAQLAPDTFMGQPRPVQNEQRTGDAHERSLVPLRA